MAEDIVNSMDAYTEISPSGEGIRILFLAPGYKYDGDKYYIKNSKIGLEIYIAGMTDRYLTVTGNVIRERDIADRSDRLPGILGKYMLRPKQETAPKPQRETLPLRMTDNELLDKAMSNETKNSDKFFQLWTGNYSGYPSQSEADMALCNMLAFWTACDSDRIDSLFRQSGLMRDKWDSHRGAGTYGSDTIKQAIANCREVYTPAQSENKPPRTKDRGKVGKDTANSENMPHEPENPAQGENAAEESPAERQEREYLARTPDNVSSYISSLMAGEIDKFKQSKDRKTGFDNLDKEAGGLYPGLYILGAITSLGKTTFVHQIADNLAMSGEHVIYFSLEQSRLELVSKSIARITAQRDMKTAVNSLAIRAGKLPKHVLKASEDYCKAVENRLSIVEGNFNCSPGFIREYVERYIKANGAKPTVIIDYLQIMQADEDKRQSTKEVVDTVMTELRRMARDMDITILAISSVNRMNYLIPFDFESLKESGGIEYTADVVWGLQLSCITHDEVFLKSGPKDKIAQKREIVRMAKAATPRKVELVCIKNRYGRSSYSCQFEYYPENDLYRAVPEFEDLPALEDESTSGVMKF